MMEAVLPIMPVTYEEHVWVPRAPGMFSKAEIRRQSGPYASAVVQPVTGWMPTFDAETVADIEQAALKMQAFDAHLHRVLGAHTDSLAPMSAILLRTESASSSQIEQISSSAKQLALTELGRGTTLNARTVVGNVRAMGAALGLSGEITLDNIVAMHRELLMHQAGMEGEAGTLRRELVWIGGRDAAGPRDAVFIPPQHDMIHGQLEDLVAFIERVDLPSLVQIAVAHAQFEMIHPFVDGNGRTGRALVQALAKKLGLIRATAIPLSAGILTDIESYFAALTEFRHGDAGPIVRLFAQAARFAAVTGSDLVDSLAEQLDDARSKLSDVRSQSAAWRVLPLLVAQPVVDASYVKDALSINDAVAQRALAVLTERGIVVERSGKGRHRVWQSQGILDVLDDYAQMIRRASARR